MTVGVDRSVPAPCRNKLHTCQLYAGPRSATLVRGDRRDALSVVLNAATVIMMTADEAVMITGCADPRAACEHLLLPPVSVAKWVIVKQGKRGAILGERYDAQSNGIRTIERPAFNVPVEDTVGCGDSFAAAVRICTGALSKEGCQVTLPPVRGAVPSQMKRHTAMNNHARAQASLSILFQSISQRSEPHYQSLRRAGGAWISEGSTCQCGADAGQRCGCRNSHQQRGRAERCDPSSCQAYPVAR
jgi:pfkB family carbohydrate kinase